MRSSAFLGAAIAALGIGSIASTAIMPAGISDDLRLIKTRQPRSRGGKPPFRYRTGSTYPHSSERQRARYARQIAAGQIKLSPA